MVPLRYRLLGRSKVLTPSGLGYSMGGCSAARPVAWLSGCLVRSVHGSLPSVSVSSAAFARPPQSPNLRRAAPRRRLCCGCAAGPCRAGARGAGARPAAAAAPLSRAPT